MSKEKVLDTLRKPAYLIYYKYKSSWTSIIDKSWLVQQHYSNYDYTNYNSILDLKRRLDKKWSQNHEFFIIKGLEKNVVYEPINAYTSYVLFKNYVL